MTKTTLAVLLMVLGVGCGDAGPVPVDAGAAWGDAGPAEDGGPLVAHCIGTTAVLCTPNGAGDGYYCSTCARGACRDGECL